ncbi:hypothetical protein AB0K60_11710 [Thermopolyspora sp. NPDC052614]|uniref:hypothetical protein n=1 Tax=Thermopolyspora sp. NPDC052614 TaxID=3155682 RepID=UPI003421E57C
MIGGPQFLSHMAYIASPDRFRDDDPPPVNDDQAVDDDPPAVDGPCRERTREGGQTP